MRTPVALDTGPLVAFLTRTDSHHAWARDAWSDVAPPMLTTEPVITEALHLLARVRGAQDAVLELISSGVLTIPFVLASEASALRALLTKYRNVPISLADASLVRMSELYPDATVLTLDRDFRIYRRFGRQVIPVFAPW